MREKIENVKEIIKNGFKNTEEKININFNFSEIIKEKRYFIVIYSCTISWNNALSWNWIVTNWTYINEISFIKQISYFNINKKNILITNIMELNKNDYFEYIKWNTTWWK